MKLQNGNIAANCTLFGKKSDLLKILVKRNIPWEVLQTMISKFQRSLCWNVWVLHTMEQSCLICYHFKWEKPKTQIPSKLWLRLDMENHLFILINFFIAALKSVNVLWIKKANILVYLGRVLYRTGGRGTRYNLMKWHIRSWLFTTLDDFLPFVCLLHGWVIFT